MIAKFDLAIFQKIKNAKGVEKSQTGNPNADREMWQASGGLSMKI